MDVIEKIRALPCGFDVAPVENNESLGAFCDTHDLKALAAELAALRERIAVMERIVKGVRLIRYDRFEIHVNALMDYTLWERDGVGVKRKVGAYASLEQAYAALAADQAPSGS